MRSRYHWIILGAALVVAGGTVGQEKEQKSAPAPRPIPYPVEVRFADDSTIKAALLDKSIEVATRYGKLTVPAGEVRGIEFGLRIPADTARRIDAAVAKLASQDFTERETASADLLELRELAYPALQQAARNTDAEVSRRAKEVIKSLADTVLAEKLHLPQHDTVSALDFTIVGRIETPSLKARTQYFGETTLKLADVRAMRWLASEGETKLTVDAARYGKPQEVWMDTGLKVRAGAGLQVAATGAVELGTGSGDTVMQVGPDGRTPRPARGGAGGPGGGAFPGGGGRGGGRGGAGAFVGTTSSPGALLGRIGEYGKVFVVGSRYDGTAAEDGNLYLRIVPASSGGESSGTYDVRVITGR